MIGDPPNEGINSLVIAEDRSLRFEEKEENKLGSGTYGKVYRGTFKGNGVAVKVLVKEHSDDEKKQKREMEEHLQLDHENVLKLLHVDDSRDKICLVLELCAGTLTDYCEKKYNGPELPPNVLNQIANGLHYIHSRNLVHRDVKPDNILISMTTPVQMKLSDFGFVKKTSPRGTFTQSGVKGTIKWMAPEILELVENMDDSITELPRGTIQSDTFAAGCVFFYFLTRGKHPFGSFLKVPGNILDNNPMELIEHMQNLKEDDDRALYELIGKMIKPKDDRIGLPKVIEQLTAKLYHSCQFKRVARFLREGDEKCVSRFHPKKPVIACGIQYGIIFFSAENSSIPFSNWKEIGIYFHTDEHSKEIWTMEWNADGTQLAAIANNQRDEEKTVIVWSFPSGEILFHEKFNKWMNQIEWNPFRPNLFATSGYNSNQLTFFNCNIFSFKLHQASLLRRAIQAISQFLNEKIVFFFNSCPVDHRPFHFCTIKHEEDIMSFQWISANRVALRLRGIRRSSWGIRGDGGIEIWEIDESTTSAQLVKRFQHGDGPIADMAWDERTKCFATCSVDGWITIWSMDSDQPIHATEVDGRCCSLAWRPNGKQTDGEEVDAARKPTDNFILACGLWDGRIVIWTPLDSKEKTRILISQHSSDIEPLSFSPDGRFLASADWNRKLIIWATENWQPVYIGEDIIWGGPFSKHFSWSSSSSTDVPDYKLTFYSDDGKIRVVEHVDGQ